MTMTLTQSTRAENRRPATRPQVSEDRDSRLSHSGPPEEHSQWWVSGPYPATVRGTDAIGSTFADAADVEGICATDLVIRLRRRVVVDEKLFVVVQVGPTPHTLPLRIALSGRVWRVQAYGHGSYEVDVTIVRHRFL